ncbi:MAG TPA: hypothetical protein VLU43_16160 [Anaeromyxobacteraceae bacterium]|nr:hypothetical protein [Anaeromyxobacteraceae bacterium]
MSRTRDDRLGGTYLIIAAASVVAALGCATTTRHDSSTTEEFARARDVDVQARYNIPRVELLTEGETLQRDLPPSDQHLGKPEQDAFADDVVRSGSVTGRSFRRAGGRDTPPTVAHFEVWIEKQVLGVPADPGGLIGLAIEFRGTFTLLKESVVRGESIALGATERIERSVVRVDPDPRTAEEWFGSGGRGLRDAVRRLSAQAAEDIVAETFGSRTAVTASQDGVATEGNEGSLSTATASTAAARRFTAAPEPPEFEVAGVPDRPIPGRAGTSHVWDGVWGGLEASRICLFLAPLCAIVTVPIGAAIGSSIERTASTPPSAFDEAGFLEGQARGAYDDIADEERLASAAERTPSGATWSSPVLFGVARIRLLGTAAPPVRPSCQPILLQMEVFARSPAGRETRLCLHGPLMDETHWMAHSRALLHGAMKVQIARAAPLLVAALEAPGKTIAERDGGCGPVPKRAVATPPPASQSSHEGP